MAEVGIRELRNALSRYLDRVREGETIIVTDRGRPVARIIPTALPEEIALLIAEGRASWSGERFRVPKNPPRPKPGPPLSTYIAEDRR
jgi:prevent-host-death family protein